MQDSNARKFPAILFSHLGKRLARYLASSATREPEFTELPDSPRVLHRYLR